MAHDGRWRRESGPDSSTVGAGSFLELEMAPLNLLTFLGDLTTLKWTMGCTGIVIVTRRVIEYDMSRMEIVHAGIKEDFSLTTIWVSRTRMHKTAEACSSVDADRE